MINSMKKVIAFLAIGFIIFSCQTNTELSSDSFEPISVSMPPNVQEEKSEFQQKLIKEAHLRFVTEDLGKTRVKILKYIQKRHGYISGESNSTTSYEVSEKITVKVPAHLFDSLISDVAGDVEKFEVKEILVKDVTSEYIDLQSRINNKKVLEKRFLKLLDKAVKIDEILDIERKIAQVREDIEKAEGRLSYLSGKVRYSQINIEYYKINYVAPTFSAEISSGFVNGWSYIKEFVVGIVNVWPFLLLFLIGWLMIRERKLFLTKKEKATS